MRSGGGDGQNPVLPDSDTDSDGINGGRQSAWRSQLKPIESFSLYAALSRLLSEPVTASSSHTPAPLPMHVPTAPMMVIW